MTTTTKLGLELLANQPANQTMANTTFAQLNQLVQTGVVDKDLSAPPGSPANEALYIVASGNWGTGSDKTGQLAYWLDSTGVWQFIVPSAGFSARILDELDGAGLPKVYGYTGSAWAEQPTGGFTGGTLTSAINEAPITTLASAAAINIGAELANTISISGTTTITSLGTIAAGARRVLVFQGALILTHNAASLILPTAANITTAAGDVAEFVSLGSGNWRCSNYQRASGSALDKSRIQSITVACSDEATALTAGAAKVTFRMPYAFTLTAVYAELTTAQSSGSIFTVDINEAGASILSTKLTIDNTEDDSATAVTPAVISDAALASRAKITIDIDQVGDGTAKGLKVTLVGYQP